MSAMATIWKFDAGWCSLKNWRPNWILILLTYDEQDEPTSDSANEESNQTRKRKRNIIWCNPPYSTNVKTNVGRIFFKLLRKHFPPSHPMYSIFNANKIKISYSCFPNIGSIISSPNKKILYLNNTEMDATLMIKINVPCIINA